MQKTTVSLISNSIQLWLIAIGGVVVGRDKSHLGMMIMIMIFMMIFQARHHQRKETAFCMVKNKSQMDANEGST